VATIRKSLFFFLQTIIPLSYSGHDIRHKPSVKGRSGCFWPHPAAKYLARFFLRPILFKKPTIPTPLHNYREAFAQHTYNNFALYTLHYPPTGMLLPNAPIIIALYIYIYISLCLTTGSPLPNYRAALAQIAAHIEQVIDSNCASYKGHCPAPGRHCAPKA